MNTKLIVGIILLVMLSGCAILKGAKTINEGVNFVEETIESLGEFKQGDLELYTKEQLIKKLHAERSDHNESRAAHNDEKIAHKKTKQSNGTHISLLMSLIFWIGGPLIIGVAIALKTYLMIPPKPMIITGIIFTCMPILINVGNDIATELGDWFIMLAKVVSGIAVLGAAIYTAVKYKKRIARVAHYGQYATMGLNEKEKEEFNKGFAEDAKAKGLSHCKDDKKLIAGVKNILDKAGREVKKNN